MKRQMDRETYYAWYRSARWAEARDEVHEDSVGWLLFARGPDGVEVFRFPETDPNQLWHSVMWCLMQRPQASKRNRRKMIRLLRHHRASQREAA